MVKPNFFAVAQKLVLCENEKNGGAQKKNEQKIKLTRKFHELRSVNHRFTYITFHFNFLEL